MNNTEPTTDVDTYYPVQIKVINYVPVMAPPQCLSLSVCVHLFVCPTPPHITPYNNWEINLHFILQNSAISSNAPSPASSYTNIQFLMLLFSWPQIQLGYTETTCRLKSTQILLLLCHNNINITQ